MGWGFPLFVSKFYAHALNFHNLVHVSYTMCFQCFTFLLNKHITVFTEVRTCQNSIPPFITLSFIGEDLVPLN